MKVSSKWACRKLSACTVGELIFFDNGSDKSYYIVSQIKNASDQASDTDHQKIVLIKFGKNKIELNNCTEIDVVSLGRDFEFDIEMLKCEMFRKQKTSDVISGVITIKDEKFYMRIDCGEWVSWMDIGNNDVYGLEYGEQLNLLDNKKLFFSRWSIMADGETMFTFDASDRMFIPPGEKSAARVNRFA